MDRPVDQPESPFEILRRLENLVRVGTVEEVRTKKPARVRVRCGEMLTNWRPWVAGRAGGEAGATWWPPVKGEQVLMFSPGGDLSNAVVLPGAYSDKNQQASEDPKVFQMDLGGGGVIKHNAEFGNLQIEAVGSITISVLGSVITMNEQEISLSAGGSTLTISADGVVGSPDVIAQEVSLASHKHPGVARGDEETGPPL
ncbi:phage baseplate assembly protein V [Acidovorax sp. ACV02]|uniref:phage baseplate assembly protein V n=1 Tax=Acidovorax sp. ACV02 TaxID=2769310 RepID=UPI001CE09A51|nr:phage baseplate assembly protein V [Acidovorax sp. ACV02]